MNEESQRGCTTSSRTRIPGSMSGCFTLRHPGRAEDLEGAVDHARPRAAQDQVDLDEAQKLKDEAQALLAEYQRKQRDAMREAEDIIANAKSLAQRQIKDAGREAGSRTWRGARRPRWKRSPRPRPRPWPKCAAKRWTWRRPRPPS